MWHVTEVLMQLFLIYLPPIPALNKWLANGPALAWLILGICCHRILERLWAYTIFRMPGLFVEGDGAFSNFRLMSQSQSQRTPNRVDSDSEDGDGLGGSMKIRQRARKRRHAKLQKREVSYHVYFEAMQFVQF